MEYAVKTDKKCSYCENYTTDYITKKTFCCDVSWLRYMILGFRPVRPHDTCKRFALHKKYGERTR